MELRQLGQVKTYVATTKRGAKYRVHRIESLFELFNRLAGHLGEEHWEQLLGTVEKKPSAGTDENQLLTLDLVSRFIHKDEWPLEKEWENLPISVSKDLSRFAGWWETNAFEVVETGRPVCSAALGCAGTVSAILRDGRGSLWALQRGRPGRRSVLIYYVL